ncbi:MAG: APC family permease, partial [Firmicutes bacterium]|nr:APC family permease [Bacillota bacterium]
MAVPVKKSLRMDPDVSGYRRALSFRDLLMISISGVVGSGWLFGSYYAAKDAGPSSLLAWLLGGGIILLGASVNAELVGMFPRAGGSMRYPLYSHGSFVGFMVAWASWIPGAAGAATESAAVMQYASSYIPSLFHAGTLTGLGIGGAAFLVMTFSYINYLGIQWFARINTPLTFIKLVVPAVTVIILLATSFHAHNLDNPAWGGFMPDHVKGIFVALATSGIVYAYLGSSGPIELAAEAKDPQRQIPRVLFWVVGLSVALYTLLQLAFLGAVPAHLLNAGGWGALHFSSPFANLLIAVNLVWFSYILYGDAVLSPSGAGLTGTAVNSRILYALGLEQWMPQSLAVVDKKRGVPVRALLTNSAVSLIFLLPFPSWQEMVGIIVTSALILRIVLPVSLGVLRKTAADHSRPFKLPALSVLAPLATVFSSLIIYWVGWPTTGLVMIFFAIGLILYVVRRRGRWPVKDLRHGIWLIWQLGFLTAMSAVGSYGGLNWIPAPWDSLLVAADSVAVWYWGVSSGKP